MKIIYISYKLRMIKDVDFQSFFYKKQLDTSFKMRCARQYVGEMRESIVAP